MNATLSALREGPGRTWLVTGVVAVAALAVAVVGALAVGSGGGIDPINLFVEGKLSGNSQEFLGGLIGGTALFAFAAYAVGQFSQRLRMYTLAQQCALAFVLVLVCEAVRHVVRGLPAIEPSGFLVLAPALTSAAAWPLIRIGLRGLCRRFRIE